MLDTLSFTVIPTPSPTDDDNEPYVWLKVVPLINGISVKCALFDVADILAQDTQTGYFEPFTCSCGVAGCAGIFESPYLYVHGDTLEWRFPEDYFRESFPKDLTADRSKLVYSFGLESYRRALESVMTELQRCYDKYLRTSFFIGSDPHEEDFDIALVDIVANIRERRKQWLAGIRLKEETFGDMLGAEARAMLPDGSIVSVNLVRMADSLAYTDMAGTDDVLGADRDAAFVRYGKKICATSTSAIEMVKSLSWDDLQYNYSFEKVGFAVEVMESDEVDQYVRNHWLGLSWDIVMPDYIGKAV